MIFKEEQILLPMALQNLTETEWGEIFAQSPAVRLLPRRPARRLRAAGAPRATCPAAASAEAARSGIAFAPGPFAAGARAVPLAMAGAARAAGGESLPEAVGKGLVVLPTGALSLEQLKAVFATLPVDLTFVDADDRVRFFSEGQNRVFARPKAILGRLVQHCHPPGSVDVVERILADFRSGRQDVAEFWIDFQGRFVHIRYFALRDEAGAYLGTLEVTQDLTRERALEGERRLLEYESQPCHPTPARPITPATKVAELLESWPELEEVLIAPGPRLPPPAQPRAAADRGAGRDARAGGRRRGRRRARARGRAAPRGRARAGGRRRRARGAVGRASGPCPSGSTPRASSRRSTPTRCSTRARSRSRVANERRARSARASSCGSTPASGRCRSSRRWRSRATACYVREASPGRFETFVSRG